jgi:hypothetical protein
MMNWRMTLVFAALVIVVGGGLFILGRVTSDRPSGTGNDYFNGLRVGEAQGRQEGRALQAGSELPSTAQPSARAAFSAGYSAGANDAFGGFDGGWAIGAPYVVTIEKGSGDITYRIAARTTMASNTSYYVCPDGHSICQAPRSR